MKRIIRNAYLIGTLLALGTTLVQSWGLGVSILVGTLVAGLNFSWMKGGLERALAVGEKARAGVLFKYLLRLLLIWITLFAMIRVSFLSLTGAIVGLSVFVLAGMLEAVFLLWERPGKVG